MKTSKRKSTCQIDLSHRFSATVIVQIQFVCYFREKYFRQRIRRKLLFVYWTNQYSPESVTVSTITLYNCIRSNIINYFLVIILNVLNWKKLRENNWKIHRNQHAETNLSWNVSDDDQSFFQRHVTVGFQFKISTCVFLEITFNDCCRFNNSFSIKRYFSTLFQFIDLPFQ